jgi:hypothetical protein
MKGRKHAHQVILRRITEGFNLEAVISGLKFHDRLEENQP